MLDELATLGAGELAADTYGEGGSVEILENEVRELLDMPAAVFMPSGTMIQQVALRIHADRRSSRVVAFHPTCHLEQHEDKAYQRLHGLVGRPVGSRQSLITLADLEDIHEPLAALLLELPQREIGGQLPAWKDLVAQVEWAHEHGAAVHLDGARLWECGPFYARPLAEIAALFDTVYVSFYKGIGGTAGGMLLGTDDVIAEAREWRHRHGGTLFNLWPYAASALAGLRLRLPRMQRAYDHAQAIAAELQPIDGVTVVPAPAADADDASPAANDRGRLRRRRSTAGNRGTALDLGRFARSRGARPSMGRALRRRWPASAHARRNRRRGPHPAVAQRRPGDLDHIPAALSPTRRSCRKLRVPSGGRSGS